jgi:hypothetical protein
MQDFTAVKQALLDHLPRPAVGGAVSVDASGLTVAAPGVSVGDMARLLHDLTGDPGFLPDGLPIADLTLETLRLARPEPDDENEEEPEARFDFDLAFTVTWKPVSLRLADAFPLRLAKLTFEKRGRRLFATGEVAVEIEGHALDVTLELPAQVLQVRLDGPEAQAAAGLVAGRGLIEAGGKAKLQALSLSASLPFRHVVLHVEAVDLFTIGPVRLASAAAEVVLAGAVEAAAIEVDAVALVEVAGNRKPLEIAVSGSVDAQGWQLAGTLDAGFGQLTVAGMANGIARGLAIRTAPALPSFVGQLQLRHLGLALDTHDSSFILDCTLAWPHEGLLVIHLEKAGDRLLMTGTLTLGDVLLKLAFAEGKSSAVLVGAFEAAGGKPLTLDALLAAVSVDAAKTFGRGGTGIAVGIKAAGAALPDTSHALLAVDLDAGIDLARLGELPLLGTLMPKGQKLGVEVGAYYLSPGFPAAAQGQAAAQLPAALGLPATLADGAHFRARLLLGGDPIDLAAIDLGNDPSKAAPPTLDGDGKPAATPPAPAGGSGPAVTWVKVGRSLGPLRIDRAGYALETTNGAAIELVLDAEITVAGLTLALDGLGARYDFDSRKLEPRLQGLGLDISQGPVEIGGAFLNVDGDFAGKVVIKAEAFSLTALGAFTMLDGAPSMFAYGMLDMPLGGPVFFFVEGLAAGVGVHRRITMPRFAEVRQFPLVEGAVQAATGPIAKPDPGGELRRLHHFIAPSLGEYFVAVGVKFNSFKLLHGFLVLVARAGRTVEIDLIGTASFASPPDLPASVPALARIDLDVMGRFRPAEGFLGIEGRLNPKSYVYGPPCHLSGGFAFYTWVTGRHAGDFVLTVGGYHPRFRRPAHYPTARRIELKYQVTPSIYLKGDAYFAMTPAVMMAGGGLHAQLEKGSLHAWADFTVDFIVNWEPFHYDITVHVEIGAKWKCFHTTASADLHIWGPEFSGLASVSWFVFSFDVAFGAKAAKRPKPISFAKFQKSFLGVDGTAGSADAVLGILPAGGVVGETVAGRPVVAAAGLRLRTSSRLPTSKAVLGKADQGIAAPKLGIAPVGGKPLGVSIQTITATRDGRPIDAEAHFKLEAATTRFPAALWSRHYPVDQNARPIEAVSGFELVPKDPPRPVATAEMRVSDLPYDPKTVTAPPPVLAPVSDAVPTSLPEDELQALGLDVDGLSLALPPPRPAITLGAIVGGPIDVR